jgi:hypothetical protein
MSPQSTPGLRLAVLAATLVAGAYAGPARAQMPVKGPSSSPTSLPPMPSPQPINTTPPDMTAVGSSPAVTGVASPTPGPIYVAAPAAAPAAPSAPAPATPRADTVAPAPGVAVAPPRRRAWGEGTTLLNRDAKIGVYIAPTFAIASVNRLPGFMLGADFGVLLGERFAVGAAGRALVTPLAAMRNDGRTFNLRLPYAGVTLAVALVRVKFFSIGISTLLGGGRVCLNDERLDRCVNRAAMFVAEPELGLHFALTKFLRLVVSGGYRVVVAQAWSGPQGGHLGGLSGTLALRLGKF